MEALELSAVQGTADAPHGAMQFEFAAELALPGAPFVWVMPRRKTQFADARLRNCECQEIYPVVVALLPDVLKKLAEEEIRRHGTREVGICACAGRVIE